MEALAGLATLLFIAVGAGVGLRLVLLASKTRALPEALLGSGLFLIVGVGYGLLIAAGAVPNIARTLAALAVVVMALGWFCTWEFTRRVFRAGSPLAAGVTALGMLALAVGALSQVQLYLNASSPIGELERSWAWQAIRVSALACYLWSAAEALRYCAMLRRRTALGLADPVVANRFLLWAGVMIFSFLSLGGPAVSTWLGGAAYTDPGMQLWIAANGFLCTVSLYLAFLPPAAYRRWLEQGQPAPASAVASAG
ncbi:MAG: hypothetical protein AAF430_02275 [Myxococcota bacterium]